MTSDGGVRTCRSTETPVSCQMPRTARSQVPKHTAPRRDVERYIAYFNFDRAHLGRYTKGRTPGEVVYGSRKMHPS